MKKIFLPKVGKLPIEKMQEIIDHENADFESSIYNPEELELYKSLTPDEQSTYKQKVVTIVEVVKVGHSLYHYNNEFGEEVAATDE